MALSLNPSRLRLTTAQWFGKIYRSGAGSVTSVSGSGGTTGLTLTGGPIVIAGTLTLGGVLNIANGGTGGSSALTPGSVVFVGAGPAFTEDNATFFWDNTNKYHGIGTATPSAPLHISRSFGATGSNGIGALTDITATAADANGRYGFLSNVTTSHVAGTVAGVSGLASNVFINGVGGNVTNCTHYLAATSIAAGAGPITTRYGLRVLETTGAGATNVINQYGLYVAQLANATNNYAIYTAGTTVSLFNGEVQSPKLNGGILGEVTGGIVRGNKIGVGILTPIATVPGTTIQTCGFDAGASVVEFNQFGDNTFYPTLLFRKGRNTMAAPSAVQSDDYLSLIGAFGYGATTWNATASGVIAMLADSAHTDASRATRIIFGTTPTVSTTVAERMRITPAGDVMIGTTSDTGSTLQVNGTVEIVNGCGGGYKFEDGSIQYTAVGGLGGAVPSTRLINTTLPLSGGGDLSADRTLSIAIDPTNDGGAVALQAATPGAAQTGHINIAAGGGFMLADSVLATTQMKLESNTAGILEAVVYNTDGFGGDHSVCSSNTLQVDNCTAYTLLHNDHYTGTGARQASSMALLANANATGGISIAAQAAAPIRFYTGGITSSEVRATLGSTGHLDLELSKPTAGTMTVTNAGLVKTVISRYDWTKAMVLALGGGIGTATGEITVCTLRAKEVVTNAYVVITDAETFAGTLTISLGRTGAGYIDYVVASDAKAAANTIYGNDTAERGTNMTGYDLPSFSATTAVKAQFVAGGGKTLDDVLATAGAIYIETMLLP